MARRPSVYNNSNRINVPQNVHVGFPSYHSPQQQLIMNALMLQGVEEVWVACGTKFGKTLGLGVGLGVAAITDYNKIWRWTAPLYQQAKIGKRYMERLLPEDPFTLSKDSDLPRILLPLNNSEIQFWHGNDPESKEGEGVAGDVLDECSKLKPEVYASTKTTVTFTGGKIVGISTPRGKNWFYHRCMAAKEEMARALLENRVPKLVFITAPTEANPFVPRATIESARKNLPDKLFRQYFLAEFVDDSEVFTGFNKCLYSEPIRHVSQARQRWVYGNPANYTVVVGVDWAKREDFNVFTAWANVDGKLRMVAYDRFHGVDYVNSVRELVRFTKQFAATELVWHDRTGVGDAIDDMLACTNLPFTGIVFTQSSKSEMVNRLVASIHQGRCELPNWDLMKTEMQSYEVTISRNGGFSYSAVSGQHDDIVSSMILGHSCGLESLLGYSGILTADSKEDELPSNLNAWASFADLGDFDD